MEVTEEIRGESSDAFSTKFDSSGEEASGGEKKLRTEEEMRSCKYCEFQAPDWPSFAVHVLKPSHVKKFAEALKVRVAVDPVLTNMTCEVCNVTCSGHVPWNAHLMGAKHLKAKSEQAEKLAKRSNIMGGPMRNKQFGNNHYKKPYEPQSNPQPHANNVQNTKENSFATYPQPLIGLEYVEEVESKGTVQWYNCSLCDVKFDDNLKFPHLVGQKHRLNVLKLKRPEVLEGIDMGKMKRSDLTVILLRESKKLEDEEGRQQVKTKFPKNNNKTGRGGKRGRGGNRGTRGASRGGRGNRGMSNARGRVYNMGTNSAPQGYGGFSTCNDPYATNLTYNSAYNASFEESNDNGQNGLFYSGGEQPSYPNTGHLYSSRNMPSSASNPEPNISNNLAAALGGLTKFINDEEDASVAFQVSNALTRSLLSYRLTGPE